MELIVISILLTFTGAQESRLEGPQNTLSVVGSTVTLKCSSPSRNCTGIDWQRFVHGASPMTIFKGPSTMLNTNVSNRDRYSVDNSSGCDLIIKNVQLIDAGRFICSAIMSSSQATKVAYLIILETQPKCSFNALLNDTVEGDRVLLKCDVAYNGTRNTSMIWKGVDDAPAAMKNGNTISRSYSIVAFASDVPSFTCEASFSYEIDTTGGVSIVGVATNILYATCATSDIKVLYSVRDVALSPLMSNYPPGTEITCEAKGNPSPNFKWQENENNGAWMDIQNQNGNRFSMSNVSSKKYRCVAMNIVRGKNHSATSNEFQVKNTGATTTPVNSGLSFTLTVPIAIGGGVTIGVVLLLIVVILICFCARCCPGYKCCHSEDKDRVEQHQDHEMSQRPGSSRVGEQESAYASLGEDREASEYASLAQAQKPNARETVKVLDQESAYTSLGEDRDANEYESLEHKQKAKPKKKSMS